jgi:hypothetical protein
MSYNPFIVILSTMVRATVRQGLTGFGLAGSNGSNDNTVFYFHFHGLDLDLDPPPISRHLYDDMKNAILEYATEKYDRGGVKEVRLTVPDCLMHDVVASERYAEAELTGRISQSAMDIEIVRIDGRPVTSKDHRNTHSPGVFNRPLDATSWFAT